MNVQLDLLAPVHRHDGEHSRAAGRKVKAARQYELVLLTLASGEALTDDEIAARAGLLRHAAGTRRGIAVKRGLVRKAGVGVTPLGNSCSTWTLTAAGVEEVARLREGNRG